MNHDTQICGMTHDSMIPRLLPQTITDRKPGDKQAASGHGLVASVGVECGSIWYRWHWHLGRVLLTNYGEPDLEVSAGCILDGFSILFVFVSWLGVMYSLLPYVQSCPQSSCWMRGSFHSQQCSNQTWRLQSPGCIENVESGARPQHLRNCIDVLLVVLNLMGCKE